MIEPNNKQTFIFINVHTADDKCQYETFFGEKSSNQGKLIQSGTPGQNTTKRDFSCKTGLSDCFCFEKNILIYSLFITLFQ